MDELTDTQLQILCELIDGGKNTHVDLKKELSLKASTLSENIKKLESGGFIRREVPSEEAHDSRGRPREPLFLTSDLDKLEVLINTLSYRISVLRHQFYKIYAEKWHRLVREGNGNDDFCKVASLEFDKLSRLESAYYKLKKNFDDRIIEDFKIRLGHLR